MKRCLDAKKKIINWIPVSYTSSLSITHEHNIINTETYILLLSLKLYIFN